MFVASIKSLINTELLTEKVRATAVKMELESLTKSSVHDLGEGLIEVFHSILSELIQISRSARNMNTISNLRQTTTGDQVSSTFALLTIHLFRNDLLP